jgi:hypothetical protein
MLGCAEIRKKIEPKSFAISNGKLILQNKIKNIATVSKRGTALHVRN